MRIFGEHPLLVGHCQLRRNLGTLGGVANSAPSHHLSPLPSGARAWHPVSTSACSVLGAGLWSRSHSSDSLRAKLTSVQQPHRRRRAAHRAPGRARLSRASCSWCFSLEWACAPSQNPPHRQSSGCRDQLCRTLRWILFIVSGENRNGGRRRKGRQSSRKEKGQEGERKRQKVQ